MANGPFPAPTSRRLRWALGVIALLMVPLAWQLFGPRGRSVEVERKTWRYEIEIERRLLESASGWCDELPADASDIKRRLMPDPDGLRKAPSEHCRYLQPQWRSVREPRAEGEAPSAPHWPALTLSALAPDQLGAERVKERRSFYEVALRADTDQRWTCRLPLAQWQGLTLGAHFRLRVDRHGVADCASITQGSAR